MNERLTEQRKKAADQSLGLSHQVIYGKALSLIKKFAGKEDYLDFGAGLGRFVSYVKDNSEMKSYRAVDLMEKPHQLSNEIQWIQSDLNKAIELPDESLGVVTALEVVEHLENPRHVFREIYRVLRKDGILIMSTPNVESWRSIISLIKRGHFVAFTDRSYPAHITALNRKDLLRAAKESGFKFVDWAYTDKGCVPGMTSLSWQSLSLGALRGLRYSDNLFIILKK